MAGDDTLEILIKTRGGRVAAAEIKSVSDATERLADRTERQGNMASRTASRVAGLASSWAAMAGRAAMAGSAMAGAGAAAAGFIGLKFNATMESNTVAFTNFLGSTQAAEKHLQGLYKLASTTPFEFPDLVSASRRLLAFGQSAEVSNKWLGIIGDTVAGIGGGTEEINRMVAAIGQIQAKGKVSTEELLQLAELGIPAFDAVAKGTGRSMDKLFDDLRDGNVTAKEGLAALQAQLGRTFGGSSAQQAKTFSGQLSTLKDNATAAVGALTKPLFNLLRSNVLPMLNRQVGIIADWFRGGGIERSVKAFSLAFRQGAEAASGYRGAEGFFGRVGAIVGGAVRGVRAFLTALRGGADAASGWKGVQGVFAKVGTVMRKAFLIGKDAVMDLFNAFKPMMPFIRNVIAPLLGGFLGGILAGLVIAFKAVVIVVGVVARALGWLGQKAEPLRGVFTGIGAVVGLVFGGPILAAVRIGGRLGAVLRFAGGVINALGRVIGVLGGVVIRIFGAVFSRYIAAARAGFGGLRTAVGAVFGWITTRIKTFVAFFGGVPAKMVNFGKGMWEGMKQGFRNVINWIIGAWNGISFRVPGFDPPGPGPKFKGFEISVPKLTPLAEGGTIMRRGAAIVGEKGPELLDLPAGATVTPLNGMPREIVRIVTLDGRVLAEAVFDAASSAAARA